MKSYVLVRFIAYASVLVFELDNNVSFHNTDSSGGGNPPSASHVTLNILFASAVITFSSDELGNEILDGATVLRKMIFL